MGGGVAWERVAKKRKCEMRGDEMYAYFDNQLMVMGSCPNRRCNWEVSFNLRKKKGIREDMTLVETSNSVLEVAIPNAGLNPYKMVEMYKN